jgi:serine/threonine protein kinase/alpha-tubulin suppressor-like RCC1 family protein
MSLALPLQPGFIVANDFRVERPLARGGMGTLYVVTQQSTGHERVLKVMHSRLVADARNRERFLQEARASARIESDHVAQVIAAGFDDHGIPWIVMELLRGEDLSAAIARRGAFTAGESLEVFRQLGHALGAAHVAGLVHRDLKPENIFLAHPRREGVPFTVKLLDFGIAKVLEESGDARNTGALGTPLWMAPEQAERSLLSPASDVWAMGLVAFSVLTGKYYWHAGNLPDVPIERVLREVFVDAIEAPSLRAAGLGASVPPGFDAWFARCVVRDPAQRYRNATEAVAALVPVLMGPVATAEVPATSWSGNTPAPVRGPFTQETPIPAPPIDALAATPSASALGPGFGRTADWIGATPVPGSVHGAVASQSGRLSAPPQPVYASGPFAVPSQSGYGPPSQPPQMPPSQPGYGSHSQPFATPSQVTHPAEAPRGGSSPWILVGGLAFLALALIVGGVILLIDEPGARRASADAGPVATPRVDAAVVVATPPRPRRAAVRVGTVGTGFEHACALQPNGFVNCWGWNLFGQAGDPSLAPRRTPGPVPTLGGAVELAVGYAHNCARLTNGTVRCWGLNSSGQLGDDTVFNRATPSTVAGLVGVTQLALGEGHSCALLADRTVRCWGANGSGQLGDRSNQDRRVPVPVANLAGVVEVAAGNEHTCARLADGAVRCWGASSFGEVGDGWARHHYEPAPVAGLTRAVALGLGPYRSCAVRDDGSVWCWGRNDVGQIGDGTRQSRSTYVRVPGLADISDVALAAFHACAITLDGALRCWGDDESGRLGDGGNTPRTPRAPAVPLRGVREVRALEAHTCARLEDRTLRCWGANGSGQLGDGTATPRPTPIVVR